MNYNCDWFAFADGLCLEEGEPDARAGYGLFFGNHDPRNEIGWVRGRQTNDRAELAAVFRAIFKAAEAGARRPLILTDSQYAIHGTTRLIPDWNRNGWNDVPNEDLFRGIAQVMRYVPNLRVEYVQGDRVNYGNDEADTMARFAAQHFEWHYVRRTDRLTMMVPRNISRGCSQLMNRSD